MASVRHRSDVRVKMELVMWIMALLLCPVFCCDADENGRQQQQRLRQEEEEQQWLA